MASRTRDLRRKAVAALESSTTYKEFTMKLDLMGVSPYNIDVIRCIRPKMNAEMRRQFDRGVLENIDRPSLGSYAVGVVQKSLLHPRDKKHGWFDAYMANKWLERHGNEKRKKSKYLKTSETSAD